MARYAEQNRERLSIYKKEWAARNKERVRVVQHDKYVRNAEAIKAYVKQRALAYPEQTLAYKQKWERANRARVNAKTARRYAAKTLATPAWANEFFIEEAYDLAALRTRLTGIKWNVDHIVPLRSKVVCGLHVEHNLQVIPKSDNCRKSNRVWPDMPEAP